MKLVIDIPENLYKAAINGLNAEEIWDLRVAIKNGTLLPKGHGRLIDADELKKHKYHDNDKYENAVSIAQVDWQPTIIGADKEGDAE